MKINWAKRSEQQKKKTTVRKRKDGVPWSNLTGQHAWPHYVAMKTLANFVKLMRPYQGQLPCEKNLPSESKSRM
jgi:hypothetical protein